eukprot:Nitzschia sp. Nitz4//scaffold57_size113557//68947//69783//NITZ4_003998-RA/size113557-processed-gene-0.161-mRNA-1//-1//CDS//3329554867//7396//frame0
MRALRSRNAPTTPAMTRTEVAKESSGTTTKTNTKKRYTPPRNSSKDTAAPTKKAKRGNGPHLTKLLQVYKGLDDWMLPIFRSVQANFQPILVFYPGSSRHATASIVFPNVIYLDNDKKVAEFFLDDRVKEWVEAHKEYKDPIVGFKCLHKSFSSKNERRGTPLIPLKSADLLISASAGIVSDSCAKYLKPGGHFLVSDAHFDARHVFVNKKDEFDLVAVMHNDGSMGTNQEELEGHFQTTKDGTYLTPEQVNESQTKAKARRSFRLQKEGMFYLFKKK